jgi:hypothetical protein
MGSMHLKLAVLILVAAATVVVPGTADGYYEYPWNFYVVADAPVLGVTTRDVILGFYDKDGYGMPRTAPGFALPTFPFKRGQFHFTDKLMYPCRLTLQLSSSPYDFAKWVPSTVEVVVYKKAGEPEIYRKKFDVYKPVTAGSAVEINMC